MKCSVSYVQFLIQSFGISDVFMILKHYFLFVWKIFFLNLLQQERIYCKKYPSVIMHAIADLILSDGEIQTY